MYTGGAGLVKLPHKLCETCTDALTRCCEPYTLRWGDWTTENKNWIAGRVDAGKDGEPKWVWLGHQLTASAQTCVFCRFLQESLKASPWISYDANDYIILKSHFLGSEHDYENFRYGSSDQVSQYRRYYRPRLQVYNKENDTKYRTGESTFLLPLTQYIDQCEDTSTPQTFHGRVVDGNVSFVLLRRWLDTCQTKHDGRPKESAIANKPQLVYGKSQSLPSCCPKPLPPIAHFRLIDVKKRCVVNAEPSLEYAALSYVWGRAKRLLLCSNNLERLSAPNALSQDRDDLPQTFRDALWVASQLEIPYLWIDALCILQDNEQQLVEHMNIMDTIYSCATLTIVSSTSSADNSIPGVGSPRGPNQAVFKYGSKAFINSKQTFGNALKDSPWESRAWCLQEKVFSKRLLIFAESQSFYHCSCATWFEDTILESGGSSGDVYLAERSSPYAKGPRKETFAAYEAHRPLFERNFWSLVEIYSQRQLSFENDAIRAFSGILKSIEPKYGSNIWGVPEYLFARGLTWSYSRHSMSLRRKDFPSWSWAGWRGNTGAKLRFKNTLTESTESFDLQWHYHKLNDSGEYELIAVDSSKDPDSVMRSKMKNQVRNKLPPPLPPPSTKMDPVRNSFSRGPDKPAQSQSELLTSLLPKLPTRLTPPKTFFDALKDDVPKPTSQAPPSGPPPPPLSESSSKHTATQNIRQTASKPWWANPSVREDEGFGIADHPGGSSFTDSPMPLFHHNPKTMPPLSHILRFWSSSVKLSIEPTLDSPWSFYGGSTDHYSIRIPGSTGLQIGEIELDKQWPGRNRGMGEFIFISLGFFPPSDLADAPSPQLLNVMLIEWVGDVAYRVQMCEPISIELWRKSGPVWKLITLA